jgi:biopolymer transport protein ExbB/TolQ
MNDLIMFTMFPVAGVNFAWVNSNPSGKFIVVLLLVGSVFAWSVMLVKIKELLAANRSSRQFVAAYRKEGDPVGLFLKRRTFIASPLHTIYLAACNEIGVGLEARGIDPQDLFLGGVGSTDRGLDKSHINAVRNVSERTVADQAMILENNMGFLATATTTAPFLGLLGTVWGVMEAFAGMAAKGSAMLSAVAPGISGALLTTVVGLIVALPSAIGYNMLSDRIRRLTVQMDNFAQELVADIERHYSD